MVNKPDNRDSFPTSPLPRANPRIERTGNPALLAKNRGPGTLTPMIGNPDLDRLAEQLPQLLNVAEVQRLCNLSRSGPFALMHRLGPVRVGVDGSPRHRGSLRLPKGRLLAYLCERGSVQT